MWWETVAKIVGYSLLAYWGLFHKNKNDNSSKK